MGFELSRRVTHSGRRVLTIVGACSITPLFSWARDERPNNAACFVRFCSPPLTITQGLTARFSLVGRCPYVLHVISA